MDGNGANFAPNTGSSEGGGNKQSNWKRAIWVLGIFAIVLIILFELSPGAFKQIFTPSAQPALQKKPPTVGNAAGPVTLAQDKNVLQKQFGKISFPAIASQKATLAGKIDKALTALIPAQAVGLAYTAITYQGGKTGLQISFSLPAGEYRPYFESAASHVDAAGWNLLDAQRGSLYAFLEASNPSFNIKLEEFLAGNAQVNIQTISSK